MIHQDVRKNIMQAYIKYKAYYDKKASASQLKEADYVYILQPKADHQGSKIPFTEFRWIGPYIIEIVLPNKIYLVRKIGTDKTQVLHRMRMRQFTPRQPPADIAVKPQEFKTDPEVSLHHDDLYARARESDFEQPIFDAENDKAAPANLREIPLQSDYSTEEMRNTPGKPHVRSPEIFPCTDVWNLMWNQARNDRKIVPPTPAVPNTTCVITRNLIEMATTDISLFAQQVCST